MPEQIMDHTFENGFCIKCGRGRTELVAYGDPKVKLEPGNSGLSCSGATNEAEIRSLRETWRSDQDKYARIFS